MIYNQLYPVYTNLQLFLIYTRTKWPAMKKRNNPKIKVLKIVARVLKFYGVRRHARDGSVQYKQWYACCTYYTYTGTHTTRTNTTTTYYTGTYYTGTNTNTTYIHWCILHWFKYYCYSTEHIAQRIA